MNVPVHRCTDDLCPHHGKTTYPSCRCHKTPEQMLIEQRDELADLARDLRENLTPTRPSLMRLAARVDAALLRLDRGA